MTSEQLAELIRRHANGCQDAAQGARLQVFADMDGHGDGTPIGMAHEVVAAVDSCDGEARTFQRLDCLCSRDGGDAAWDKPASYQKSGDVESQSQLVRYSDLFDE
jgi:hypothetical protein